MYAQQVCLRLALSGQCAHRFTGHSQLVFDHALDRARTAPTPSCQRDAIGRGATVGVAGDRQSGSGLPGASAVTRPGRIGYLGKACDSQRSSARYSCNTLGGHMTVPETDEGCSGDHHEDTCGLAMRRYDSLRSRRRSPVRWSVAGAL